MVTTKHVEFNGSQLLQQLIEKRSLTQAQAEALMDGWLTETISPVLSSAILIALQTKGVAGEELAGMARVLQGQSLGGTTADLTLPSPRIDTCGTGGDGSGTFNISTAVSFVAAAAGIHHAAERESVFKREKAERFALEHHLGEQPFADLQTAMTAA